MTRVKKPEHTNHTLIKRVSTEVRIRNGTWWWWCTFTWAYWLDSHQGGTWYRDTYLSEGGQYPCSGEAKGILTEIKEEWQHVVHEAEEQWEAAKLYIGHEVAEYLKTWKGVGVLVLIILIIIALTPPILKIMTAVITKIITGSGRVMANEGMPQALIITPEEKEAMDRLAAAWRMEAARRGMPPSDRLDIV